jgi:hypothetical protein
LLQANWFLSSDKVKNSVEIALCPYFDFLNHREFHNADWDFKPGSGEVWVETIGKEIHTLNFL